MHFSYTHTCYVPHPVTLLELITLIIFGEEYILQASSLCNFLQSSITSSLLGPNNIFNTLFSNILIHILPLGQEIEFHTYM